MKQEIKILTDNDMTHAIFSRTKGDNRYKSQVKDNWLDFTLQNYDDNFHIGNFIIKVNKWLTKNKLPIQVLNFSIDDDNAIWEVQLTNHGD